MTSKTPAREACRLQGPGLGLIGLLWEATSGTSPAHRRKFTNSFPSTSLHDACLSRVIPTNCGKSLMLLPSSTAAGHLNEHAWNLQPIFYHIRSRACLSGLIRSQQRTQEDEVDRYV